MHISISTSMHTYMDLCKECVYIYKCMCRYLHIYKTAARLTKKCRKSYKVVFESCFKNAKN